MDTETLIRQFQIETCFTKEQIQEIQCNKTLRTELIIYFQNNKNHNFAIELLNSLVQLRKDINNEISIYDLMLASFILAQHQQIEDCLKIWEAKRVDFDTYCGVDIQLVPFAGVSKTIEFLKTQIDPEANEALKYVITCNQCGDFDNLEVYYNSNNLPWWI